MKKMKTFSGIILIITIVLSCSGCALWDNTSEPQSTVPAVDEVTSEQTEMSAPAEMSDTVIPAVSSEQSVDPPEEANPPEKPITSSEIITDEGEILLPFAP